MKCLECGSTISCIRRDHFANKCNGVLKSLDEYKAKYPGTPTIDPAVAASHAVTLKNLVAKYGEEEGARRWDSYREKHRQKVSVKAFIAKGKTAQDFSDYNKSRSQTLQNMIRRHGEDLGRLKWEGYRTKQKTNGKTLEYFVQKYGDRGEEVYLEVNKRKGITLANMIAAHGEEEGTARWHQWLERTKGNYISENAKEFVKMLWELLPSTYMVHDGVYSKEFCVYKDRPYFFDFVITHPFKAVVEYNGDFWHANPTKYAAEDLVPIRGGGIKAQDLWERDAVKLQAIKERGFDVLVVWDSEFLANKVETIRRVQQWLSEKNESHQ